MVEVVESELQALFTYWDSKRAGRVMPSRADLDPIDIPRLLAHLVLVETAGRIDDFRYRLFGTAVCRGFGHDRTGTTLGALKDGVDNYDSVYAGYWRTYSEATPDYFYGGIVSLAKDYRRYSRLLLPLSKDGRVVNMILGGMVFFTREDSRPLGSPGAHQQDTARVSVRQGRPDSDV